jgi:hypothetical protein
MWPVVSTDDPPMMVEDEKAMVFAHQFRDSTLGRNRLLLRRAQYRKAPKARSVFERLGKPHIGKNVTAQSATAP